MLAIQGVFAQMERQLTGERVKEHNQKRHHDRYIASGYPSLGLLRHPKSSDPYFIDPVALAVATRVFELFLASGGNLRETVRRLNAEGVPTRRGASWHTEVVRHILSAPNYRRKLYYAGELIDAPDLIPETIAPELVERVSAILTARYGTWHVKSASSQPRTYATSTYSGLLSCGRCGALMDFRRAKPGEPGKSPSFACRGRNGDWAGSECRLPILHGPTIDAMVGECIRQSLASYAGIVGAKKAGQPARVVVDTGKKMEALEGRRRRAFTAYVDGHVSSEYFQAERDRLDREEAALRALPTEPQPPEPLMDYRAAADVLSGWSDLWLPTFDSAAKRELLTGVLGISRAGIVVDKTTDGVRTKRDRWSVTIRSAKLGTVGPYTYTGRFIDPTSSTDLAHS